MDIVLTIDDTTMVCGRQFILVRAAVRVVQIIQCTNGWDGMRRKDKEWYSIVQYGMAWYDTSHDETERYHLK